MNKLEQIEAILGSKESALAKKYFNGDMAKLESSWTVSKKEVIEYINHNGFPKGWVSFEESSYDGLYLLKKEHGWEWYYQDSGKIISKKEFKEREEAMSSLLDTYYLKRRNIR